MRTLITAVFVLGLVGLDRSPGQEVRPDRHLEVGDRAERTEAGDGPEAQARRGQADRDDHGRACKEQASDVKIEDGKFKDGEVTFTVTREFNEQKRVTKYAAKVDGDTLKGTATSERDGQERKQEFEAKREKVKD